MHIGADTAAIVTGGASGLGAATVRELRAKGAQVSILDIDATRGHALARETGAVFCACDITSDGSVDTAMSAAAASNGEARILVNCAGISQSRRVLTRPRDGGALVLHESRLFERMLAVNLAGTFRTIVRFSARAAALTPLDGDGLRGVIVNTGSIAALEGQIGQAAYSASKSGAVGMTLPLARDLSRHGVRVMAILPGSFDTPMFDTLPDEHRKRLELEVPFPSRLGRPEEFGRLVVAIVENDMLNGEAIRLDGAARMPPR